MKPVGIISVGAACLLAGAVPAAAKHHRHHVHWTSPPPIIAVTPDQPHMVQVKPGLWISSWGCVTDEGGGRLKPCEVGRN